MAHQPIQVKSRGDAAAISDDPHRSDGDAKDIEHTIDRLKSELSERRCDDRPLPGSVEHAYQVTIDKYYARLERCRRKASADDTALD